MFSALWMFIPQEAYPLMLVLAGVLLIIGLRKVAFGIVGFVLLISLFGPFIDALIAELPGWAFALLCIGLVVSLIRMIFGRGITDHLGAMLIYDLLRAPFRFIGWLLRGCAPRRR